MGVAVPNRTVFAALAVLLAAPGCAYAQVAAELEKCVRGATAAQIYGTYDLAIHHCSQVIRDGRVPEEIMEWVLTQRGTAYQGKGALARAGADRETAQAFTARATADLATARQMAVVREMNEMEQRVAAVQRAADTATRAVLRAQIIQADADRLQTQAELVAALYEEAALANPQSAIAYLYRGVMEGARGEFEAAAQSITAALALDPNMALSHYNRGVVYLLLAHNEQALTDLEEAARLAPNRAATFYNRGIARARAGEMVPAILDFTEAIALMPNYVEAFNNRGFAFEVLGERERAEADFLTAYRLQPENPRFRRKLLDLGLAAALTQ